MSAVALIGFMGAGKTTVGRLLAEGWDCSFVDLDERIESRESLPVAELFASRGESGFRAAEREALRDALGSACVIACGGGVVTDEESRGLLRDATVVYLRVTAAEALARVGTETAGRPLMRQGGIAAAETLLASRLSLYEAAADHVVDTAGLTPAEVADRIAASVVRP